MAILFPYSSWKDVQFLIFTYPYYTACVVKGASFFIRYYFITIPNNYSYSSEIPTASLVSPREAFPLGLTKLNLEDDGMSLAAIIFITVHGFLMNLLISLKIT